MSLAITRGSLVFPKLAAHAPSLMLAASVAVIGGALVFQYGFGVLPCEMCHWQRWPYFVVMAVSGGLIVAAPKGATRRAGIALCGLAFLVTAAIGAWQVGIEQGWLPGPTACTGIGLGAATVEELQRQIMAAPVVRCDEVQWSLFGVSLAGFNVLIAGALALFAFAAARAPQRAGP